MKNTTLLLITIICIFFSSNSYAQERVFDNPFSKGSYLIGGSFNVKVSNSETSLNDTLTIFSKTESNYYFVNPSIGKFINENFLVGTSIFYGYSRQERSSEFRPDIVSVQNNKGYNFGATIFAKKYFFITSKFGAFLSPSVSFSRTIGDDQALSVNDLNYNSNISEQRLSNYAISTNAGLFMRIGKRFLLETNLAAVTIEISNGRVKYNRTINSDEREDKIKSNEINLNFANKMSLDQLITINYIFNQSSL